MHKNGIVEGFLIPLPSLPRKMSLEPGNTLHDMAERALQIKLRLETLKQRNYTGFSSWVQT